MPGYIIHLSAAKELVPLLQQQKLLKTPEDINAFLVSALMPDSASDKTATHYRQTDDTRIQIRYPQPWRLAERYPHLIQTPAGLGYLFHLYTDYLFYQEYLCRHIKLTDSDSKPQVCKDQIEQIILSDFNRTLYDGLSLFRENRLYHDYTILNALLEKRYQLTYQFSPVENPGFEELDYSRFSIIQEAMIRYSEESKHLTSHETFYLKPEPLFDFIQTAGRRFLNEYPYYL